MLAKASQVSNWKWLRSDHRAPLSSHLRRQQPHHRQIWKRTSVLQPHPCLQPETGRTQVGTCPDLGTLPAVSLSYAQNSTSIFHSYLITTNVATKKQKSKTKQLTASTTQFLQNLLELKKPKKPRKLLMLQLLAHSRLNFHMHIQDVCKSGLHEKASDVDTSNASYGKSQFPFFIISHNKKTPNKQTNKKPNTHKKNPPTTQHIKNHPKPSKTPKTTKKPPQQIRTLGMKWFFFF